MRTFGFWLFGLLGSAIIGGIVGTKLEVGYGSDGGRVGRSCRNVCRGPTSDFRHCRVVTAAADQGRSSDKCRALGLFWVPVLTNPISRSTRPE